MDRIKKKVLRDVFTSPYALLPIAAGCAALGASWFQGGDLWLNVLGAGGLLGGVGTMFGQLYFRAEKLTERAYRYFHDQQQRRQEKALDELDRKLASEPDPRTEDCLRQLRRLYRGFQEKIQGQRITGQAHRVMEQVEEVFRATVDQLQLSYDLWTTAQPLKKEAKQSVLDRREQVIQDAFQTLDHLARTIEQFHAFQVEKNTSELERLRAELDETLEVARRTEQRMAELDKTKQYEPSDFESQE